MKTIVPTLSASGWLTEISEKADSLMAYYLLSEYSQSYLYYKHILSLPYHIRMYGNKPNQLKNIVESELTEYFKRYFKDVELTAIVDIPDVNDPNRINLMIDCMFYDNGEKYSLGREVNIENSKIKKVFDKNNGGRIV